MKLKDAAALINGDLEGDGEAEVVNIAKIEDADPDARASCELLHWYHTDFPKACVHLMSS